MRLIIRYRDLRFVGLYVVLLFVLIAALPTSPGTGLDQIMCTAYLTIAVSAVAVHLVGQRSDNWLRPDILFLVGFFVVNYQWLAMVMVSGLFPERTNFLLPMENHATYAAWLSTIALLSWLTGFAIARPNHRIRVDKVTSRQLIKIEIVAIALFVAFAITVDPSWIKGDIYRTVQENLFQTVTGVSAYLLTLIEIFTLILVSMFFYSRIVDRLNVTLNFSPVMLGRGNEGTAKQVLMLYFAIYLLVFTIAGERGNVIQLLIALGVVYAMNFRAVRLIELVVLLSFAALVFTGLGIARSINEGLSLDLIFGDLEYWSLTVNMAQSAITLYQGIDIVQESGYFFGQLWLSQLLGMVPFLQSAFLSLTSFRLEEISSAGQITAHILGPNPHTGFGTSFVIDIFMNFGIPGIIVFSFLYGYICKFASVWISGTSGFARFFVAIAFVSLIFYASRSSLLIQLRYVVWGLVIVMMLVPIRKLRF